MRFLLTILLLAVSFSSYSQSFRVLGFFTAKNDRAHITYVREANKWFYKTAKENGFSYDSTDNWNDMNIENLRKYDVVLFLDTRPDSVAHRKAFEQYMEGGGAWMGFHFAGFALTPSAFPQNWDWYHNKFIGAGEYKSNTWRPTSAVLRVEQPKHPVMKGLPVTFKSQPNEWYRWKNDLKADRNIQILMSIDPSSFPLGTGPKPHEIWHEGYYPVVWTNNLYRMIYINMGHNDIDYEGKTNKQLSSSFGNPLQDKFLLNALMWLGAKKNKR
jgi:uncharacterized protein